MESTDEMLLLLRWNVAEMRRRFFVPQAYADPLQVAEERRLGLDLRERVFAHSNLRDIHDRALRAGRTTFGFWAPLATFDFVAHPPRHTEIALNARVQYKATGDETDRRVYVVIAPHIPNVDGTDADAFYIVAFPSARYFATASILFWMLLGFCTLIWMLEGPPRLIYGLLAAAVAHIVLYVATVLWKRAAVHRFMATFEELRITTGEAFL